VINKSASRLEIYIHGLTGDIAAEKKGTYSLMAEDLLEAISSKGKYIKGEQQNGC